MLLLFTLSCVNSLFLSTAKAQASFGGPPPQPPDLIEMLAQTLDLNDSQKAQIKPIAESARPQLEAVRQQAESIIQQVNAQIRPLLTAQQQNKLNAMEVLHIGLGSRVLAQ